MGESGGTRLGLTFLPDDSTKKTKSKRPDYTPEDRLGDPYSNPGSKSPFLLNPKGVQQNVILDDTMGTYTIEEKIGETDYRPPSTMTFEEYEQYKRRDMMRSYWKNKNSSDSSVNNSDEKSLIPRIKYANKEGPFGSPYIEIRPTGLVTLDFGGRWQRTANPSYPVRQQRQGQFDFDQTISMNVVGKIGDKLKLTTNWDTKAAFEFQNNLKLEYTGYEEDIIQKIEAGNVSLPLNSTLITGAQNLFGVKTKLQFGRLTATTVLSTQRGKVEEIKVQGGAQSRGFEIKADQYDDYRHFFLSQFFRDNYEKSLRALPNVFSGVKIVRVDAWITNTITNASSLRNIAGFTDLGEPDTTDMVRGTKFYDNTVAQAPKGAVNAPADNKSNTLFNQLTFTDAYRNRNAIINNLQQTLGLVQGTDYEKIDQARKLDSTEFRINRDLGYISLNTPLRPNEVLAVAFQYTYLGQTYTVGELTDNIQNGKLDDEIFLKLIKPQTIKTRLPTWDLMMKNVYQLGGTQLTRDNFQLKVIYKNDLTGADLPNLQEGIETASVPLLRLTHLDQLNPNNDPFPDGNFDYVEGVTIDSRNGRIFFPVLEPFGATLGTYFTSEPSLAKKYVFFELYDSTRSDAQQVASKNKYYLKGRYQSGSSNEIILPGINIAPGSVTVLAGSSPLVEGVDYEIDYNFGRLRIKNQGVLASNKEITIRFEKQDFINFRRKSFIGNRFDFRVNRNFFLGATLLHQTESPNISRVNIGDEPSSNTMAGVDGTFKADSRLMTRMIDKLPLIQTKAISSINFAGEGAALIPGYPKILNKSGNEGGTSYLDDFEGAETPYDLTKQPVKWRLGATPRRFIESNSSGLDYTYRRAKLAWYNIDNVFYNGGTNLPGEFKDTTGQNYLKNQFVRLVLPTEIYQGRDAQQINLPEPTLDLLYYPSRRGMYNFNPAFTGSSQNWAAITREIRNDIDFDNANIQYIEFWMMDPFTKGEYSKFPATLDKSGWTDVTSGGELYFNLGSISEDVMNDSKHAYENGLPVNAADQENYEENVWGRVTKKTFLTAAFDNSDGSREKQDVGLDGLNDTEEKNYTYYPPQIRALDDPSSDNFHHYLRSFPEGAGVLQRYEDYNGMDGNSPINNGGSYTASNSTYPDNEDLNSDNTINKLDEYYEYKVKINPGGLQVGQNYVIDKIEYTPSDSKEKVTWYQFRIPVRTPDSVVGNISGYKSIRFIRMYLTNFSNPIVLRMAQMQLVANQWRVYQPDNINPPGGSSDIEPTGAVLAVSTISMEENSKASTGKTPYTLPPGFKRDQDVISQTYRRLNEQSLRLCIDDLEDGKAKGAYKNVSLNLINYHRLKMFLHAESKDQAMLKSGDVTAFLRIGTDNTDNYYEIEVPLELTPLGSTAEGVIWPQGNEIDMAITDLTDTKGERNRNGVNKLFPYTRTLPNGHRVTVRGNPDLTAVMTLMLGIRNPKDSAKRTASVCIWADELRVTGFSSQAGYAATARMNLKLADLATVNLSGRYTTVGWGSLDQKVSQRSRVNTGEWGVSSNIALDKFLPEKMGIKLPMFVSYDQRIISPKYNPLDPDMLLQTSLSNITESDSRQKYKSYVIDKTTRKSINFTNVQKIRTKKDAKQHIYDIENLALTAAYSHEKRTNINLADSTSKYYKGEVIYAFNGNPKNYEPFKKVAWMKSRYLKPVKDFNFTLLPSTLSFRGSLDRRITKTQYYEGNPLDGFIQNPFFQKQFTFTRTYGLNWNLTKSMTLDYKANAFSIIDEPNRDPAIDKKDYQDSVLSNILRLGRMKNFDQNVQLTYKLPLEKFPVTDWVSADAKYGAGYVWTAGALGIRDTLGNFIQNNQTSGVMGKINFDKLYNKVKFLRDINNPPPPARQTQKDTSKTLPKREYKAVKTALKTFMLVKSVNFTLDFVRATTLPGYMPTPKYLGMSPDSSNGNMTQMLPFIFGSQDPGILKLASDNHWLTDRRSLNTMFTQTKSVNFTARTQIEPIKDFRIQIDVLKKTASNYQEFYRRDSISSAYNHESPNKRGSLSISVLSITTAFRGKAKGSADPYSSANFQDFERYRDIVRARISGLNGLRYDTNAQDILIPAFLAAYTKRDPSKTALHPAPRIPLPNWRIDYTGLTKIKAIRKIFPSFTISHSYTSTYNINNYTSNQYYGSNVIDPYADLYNNYSSNQYLLSQDGFARPIFVVEQVSINEAFNPLIGVNFRTNKKLTGDFQIRKARIVTLNLSNAQIQEVTSTDVTIGFGMIRSGVKIPFTKLPPLKNELNAKMNITIGDRKTIQRKFDQSATVTAGNLNVQIRPNITYAVNQRVNLMMYFERTINAPRISSSFRSSSTRFGIQVRFTLS